MGSFLIFFLGIVQLGLSESMSLDVFLTKNGRGRFVILDIEDYEKDRAEKNY